MQKPIPDTNGAYDPKARPTDIPQVETCPICSTDAILDYRKLEPLIDITNRIGRVGQIIRDDHLVQSSRREMERVYGYLAESLSNVPVRLDGPRGSWMTIEEFAAEDTLLARKVMSQLLVAQDPVVKLDYAVCPDHCPEDLHVAYFHASPGEEFAAWIMN